MPTIVLSLGKFDPDLDPVSWPYDAAVDPVNRLIILRNQAQSYAPAGGHLVLTEITLSGYGQAIDSALETQIASNELVGDGVYELLIVDEAVTDNFTAQQIAQAELAAQTAPQIQIQFESESSGWQVGQILRLVDPTEGIDATLLITDISVQFIASDRLRYQIQASSWQAPTQTDLLSDFVREQRRPPAIRQIEIP